MPPIHIPQNSASINNRVNICCCKNLQNKSFYVNFMPIGLYKLTKKNNMGLTPSPPLEHLGPQVYFALDIYYTGSNGGGPKQAL